MNLELNKIHNMDCLDGLKQLADNSVEAVITDVPYGIAFMNKLWDEDLPSVEIFKEIYRVLKKGAFFVTTFTPRQSNQYLLYGRLIEAGFNIEFSPLYWIFHSGFPKSSNFSKMADGRMFMEWLQSQDEVYTKYKEYNNKLKELKGDEQKELKKEFDEWVEELKKENGFSRGVIGLRDKRYLSPNHGIGGGDYANSKREGSNCIKDEVEGFGYLTSSATPQAKALEGWYSYSPKPAVEPIIIAQKPSGEKTLIDCALRSLTDDSYAIGGVNFGACRIPYESEENPATNPLFRMEAGYKNKTYPDFNSTSYQLKDEESERNTNPQGRFPANIVCGSKMNLTLEQLLELQKRIKSGCIPKV